MKKAIQLTAVTILFSTLALGASLSGVVTDANTGDSIENAHIVVHLVDSTHADWFWGDTFAGEDGFYHFDSLTVGSYNLYASIDGYDGFFTSIELNEDMTFDISLNEYTAPGDWFEVSGFVTDAETGEGIQHASIKKEGFNGFWFPLAWTDSTGYYSFENEGDINLKIRAWGYNTEETSVSIVSDTTFNFSLTEYGYSVSGIVQDSETGEGIPYAVIKKENDNGHWSRLTWADSTGFYSANHLEGDFNLKAMAWGYNSDEMSVTIDEDTTLNFNLSSINYDGALYGSVSNGETGSVVVGAEVRVFAPRNDSTQSHGGWGHQLYTSETDSNGNYFVENLPSSQVTVRVFENGFEFYNESVQVVDSTLFDITLSPIQGLGSVSGDVTYDDADGPANAFIRLIRNEGYGCGYQLGTWTDENGHYEILAPEGDYYVLSFATNREGGHNQDDHSDSTSFFYMEYFDDVQNIEDATLVSVVEDLETSGINFSIPFQGDSAMTAQVSGIISDASEAPISGVTLSLYDNEGSLVGSGETNMSGAYIIDGLDIGSSYNLVAIVTGFDESSIIFEQEGLITVANLELTGPLSVDTGIVPFEVSLMANYPNPFNPSTTIDFSLQKSQNIRIVIYDILGQIIAELTNSHYSVGSYSVTWNGLNQNGLAASSGVYIYSLISESGSVSQKMLLTK